MRAVWLVVMVGCAGAAADPRAEPTWFDDAVGFGQGVAAVRVRAGDKWGFIDHTGAMVVPPQFDEVEKWVGPDGYMPVRKGKTWMFVGPGGKLSAPIAADAIEANVAGIALAKVGAKYVIVDARTGAVSRESYERDDIEMMYRCPLYEVKRPKACIADRTGACIADDHGEIHEGGPQRTAYVTLKRGKQRGLYDCAAAAFVLPFAEGGSILTPEADAPVVTQNAQGDVVVYGLDGRVRLGPLAGVHTIDWKLVDGRRLVSGNAGAGYLDRDGKLVVPLTFNQGKAFSEGLAAVQRKTTKGELIKWGFIDPSGKLVIAYEWDQVGDFHDGFAPVKKGDTWGYIDRTGVVVVPVGLSFAMELSGGAASAEDGKIPMCVSIERGTLTAVAMKRFTDIGAFHAGRASVRVDGATRPDRRCGYVDEHCAVVGKIELDTCHEFDEHGVAHVEWPTCQAKGNACLWDAQRSGIVDRKLVPIARANVIVGMADGVRLPMLAGKDYQGGYISERAPAKTRQGLVWKGRAIVPVQYNRVMFPQDGFVQVRRDDGKTAFFSTVDGKPLVAK